MKVLWKIHRETEFGKVAGLLVVVEKVVSQAGVDVEQVPAVVMKFVG